MTTNILNHLKRIRIEQLEEQILILTDMQYLIREGASKRLIQKFNKVSTKINNEIHKIRRTL